MANALRCKLPSQESWTIIIPVKSEHVRYLRVLPRPLRFFAVARRCCSFGHEPRFMTRPAFLGSFEHCFCFSSKRLLASSTERRISRFDRYSVLFTTSGDLVSSSMIRSTFRALPGHPGRMIARSEPEANIGGPRLEKSSSLSKFIGLDV